MTQLETQGLAAKAAGRVLAVAGSARKDAALEAIAAALAEMAYNDPNSWLVTD